MDYKWSISCGSVEIASWTETNFIALTERTCLVETYYQPFIVHFDVTDFSLIPAKQITFA